MEWDCETVPVQLCPITVAVPNKSILDKLVRNSNQKVRWKGGQEEEEGLTVLSSRYIVLDRKSMPMVA